MIKKFINLYIEGFRNIGSTGKQLVGILFFKILIFFVIMKLLFFPNILNKNYKTDAERADHVIEQLTTKIK
jgi:hypothetical protein